MTYIKNSEVLYHGGFIDKMIFIVRGKIESIGEDGITVPLSEGDVCGEELLTWCLEHSPENRGQINILLDALLCAGDCYLKKCATIYELLVCLIYFACCNHNLCCQL